MSTPLTFDRTKCSKRNPATCRRHGKEYKVYQNFMTDLRRERERVVKQNFQNAVVKDLETNLKPRADKAGNITVSVYRSGIVTNQPVRGVETEMYQMADAEAPEGRQGRMTGIFAAPSLGGACRWAYANYYSHHIEDIQVRELRVDPNKVYVYSIKAWEKASWNDATPEGKKALMKAFWDSGIPLAEWVEKAKQDSETYDPREWELLLSEEDIRVQKPVSATRTADWTHDNNGDRLAKMLKDAHLGRRRL